MTNSNGLPEGVLRHAAGTESSGTPNELAVEVLKKAQNQMKQEGAAAVRLNEQAGQLNTRGLDTFG